jgi:hypothetical protein
MGAACSVNKIRDPIFVRAIWNGKSKYINKSRFQTFHSMDDMIVYCGMMPLNSDYVMLWEREVIRKWDPPRVYKKLTIMKNDTVYLRAEFRARYV